MNNLEEQEKAENHIEPGNIVFEEKICVFKGRSIYVLDHNLKEAFSEFFIKYEEPKRPNILANIIEGISSIGIFSIAELAASQNWIPGKIAYALGGGILFTVFVLMIWRWVSYFRDYKYFLKFKDMDLFEKGLENLRNRNKKFENLKQDFKN
jgi:hypothetical protein